MSTLPPQLQSCLDRELDEGETINWVAQPVHRLLRKAAITNWLWLGIVPVLVIPLFLVLAWTASMTPASERQDQPWTFVVAASVVFLAWGASSMLFLSWARFLSSSTVYAITDRRAIIIKLNHNKSFTERDYRGDELIHLSRTEFPDGSGTLTFESARGAGHTAQTAVRHRFHAIENVIDVERMLRHQFGDS